MKVLDIMRTSASRPELLRVSTESLAKYLKFSGRLRIFYHEDVLNRVGSDECIRYLNENAPESMRPYRLQVDDPPITQIMSMTWLIERMETKYFLNWEDDHEALREVDLDLACTVLDENPDVNQIAFHKRQTMSNRYSFIKKEVMRSGVKLTTNPHWAFTPAIWRKSFIMRYWKPPYTDGRNVVDNPVWWLNPKIKGGQSMRSAKWIIGNSGHYFMGGIGEHAFCYHIGGGKSLREGDYEFSKGGE